MPYDFYILVTHLILEFLVTRFLVSYARFASL